MDKGRGVSHKHDRLGRTRKLTRFLRSKDIKMQVRVHSSNTLKVLQRG